MKITPVFQNFQYNFKPSSVAFRGQLEGDSFKKNSNSTPPIQKNQQAPLPSALLQMMPDDIKDRIKEQNGEEFVKKILKLAIDFHNKDIDSNEFSKNFFIEICNFKGLDKLKEKVEDDTLNTQYLFKALQQTRSANHFDYLKDEENVEIFTKIAKNTPKFISPFECVIAYANLSEDSKEVYRSLIDMTDKGEISEHILKGWENSEFDEKFRENVKLYADAKKNNLTDDEIEEIFVPKTEKEDIESLKEGAVFEFEDKACIKLKEGYYKSNISRKTYMTLFPPTSFIAQGASGDCYLLSGIQSMIDDASSFTHILRCFTEEGDNLTIKLPNSITEIKTDLSGNLPKEKEGETYSKGSKGVALLEAAYEDETAEKMRNLMQLWANAQLEHPHITKRGKMLIYDVLDDINKKGGKYVVKDCPKRPPQKYTAQITDTKYLVKFEDVKKDFLIPIDSPEVFYRMDEGNIQEVYSAFGFKLPSIGKGHLTHKILFIDKVMEEMEKDSDSYLYCASTNYKPVKNTQEDIIDFKKGLLNSHLYSLRLKKDKEGNTTFVLKNPYNTSRIIELGKEEALKYIYSIGCAKNNC